MQLWTWSTLFPYSIVKCATTNSKPYESYFGFLECCTETKYLKKWLLSFALHLPIETLSIDVHLESGSLYIFDDISKCVIFGLASVKL